MNTVEKYDAAIPALCELYGKMNAWEQKFMETIKSQYEQERQPSIAQQGIIDKLIASYIDGTDTRDSGSGPFEYGDRIVAKREEGGYQAYVDGMKVGDRISKREQLVICTWMSRCIDGLEACFKMAKLPPMKKEETVTETAKDESLGSRF